MKRYDSIKFLTVKIEAISKEGSSVGTGFFMKTKIKNETTLVIATVRHVIAEAEEIYFNLHYLPQCSRQAAVIRLGCNPKWYTMGDKELCCCEVDELNEKLKKLAGASVYCSAVDEANILTETELNQLDMMHEVCMVGYPAGRSSTPMDYTHPVLFRMGTLSP